MIGDPVLNKSERVAQQISDNLRELPVKIHQFVRDLSIPVNDNECETIQVRRFTMDDVETIYHWRNHPSVRHQSINKNPIDLKSHYSWCKNKINDPLTIFLVGETENKDLFGTVRYEISKQDAVVNIYISPEIQGLGYGYKLLSKSIKYMQNIDVVERIVAEVIESNNASIKMFKRCGFSLKT